MKVCARERKLKRAIEDEVYCRRKFGLEMTKKLMRTYSKLRACKSVADLWPPKSGPERCHELKGNLIGLYSVDLQHPYRLLFRPGTEIYLVPGTDQLERWKSIKSIELISIKDTHG